MSSSLQTKGAQSRPSCPRGSPLAWQVVLRLASRTWSRVSHECQWRPARGRHPSLADSLAWWRHFAPSRPRHFAGYSGFEVVVEGRAVAFRHRSSHLKRERSRCIFPGPGERSRQSRVDRPFASPTPHVVVLGRTGERMGNSKSSCGHRPCRRRSRRLGRGRRRSR